MRFLRCGREGPDGAQLRGLCHLQWTWAGSQGAGVEKVAASGLLLNICQ